MYLVRRRCEKGKKEVQSGHEGDAKWVQKGGACTLEGVQKSFFKDKY